MNFQNSILQSTKVAFDIEGKFIDVFDLSDSNRVKEHEAVAASYGHAQRDQSTPYNW